MRKLKFVVEDLGIGAVFDAALFKFLPVAGKGITQAGKATVKGTDAAIGFGQKIGSKAQDVYNERGALKEALDEDLAPIRQFTDEFMGADPEELTALGKGIRRVTDTDYDSLRSDFAEYTQSRRNSVEAQTRESVKAQSKEAGVRFPKNEPIGSRELGNSTSNHTAADVDKACLLYTSDAADE